MQKKVVFEKLSSHFAGNLNGKTIAMWGLSFKPETDDMREAPSLVVIDLLLEAGCKVKVYDPIAMEETHRRIGDIVSYAKDMYDAAVDADALLIVTEWKQFRLPTWSVLQKVMSQKVIVDGRNLFKKEDMTENGFDYFSI